MNSFIKILTEIRQKIPSIKVDIGRNSIKSNFPIPRNTNISGHFRLNIGKNTEISIRNLLIFIIITL